MTGEASSYISTLQNAINTNYGGHIAVDGIPGPATLAACPTLQEGDSGEAVRALQFFIGLPRDGMFGPKTKNGVKWYQQQRGIVSDGIVGHNTWREILKPFAAEYHIYL
ncbi:MAG: peptidoglycan-binding domain-containing protein [Clostridiaceae bacterium]|nr:peptidoglycan-binding domain-containing protein [Clostridiaceae bacterium]